jgi:hypothetical protein
MMVVKAAVGKREKDEEGRRRNRKARGGSPKIAVKKSPFWDPSIKG